LSRSTAAVSARRPPLVSVTDAPDPGVEATIGQGLRRYSTLHTAPTSALSRTTSSPTHACAPPRSSARSPSAHATPPSVGSTPTAFGVVSRSAPAAAATSIVSSGNVAKMSAARAEGTKRSA
jgi:hypothetical protein